mgnify:CR=1 FL=1
MYSFVYDDLVILFGPKRTTHMITLKKDGKFFTSNGVLMHNDIVAVNSGSIVKTDKRIPYTVFKPTYKDFVMNIKRKAQIIYPKDTAIMLMWGDVYPGLEILESGVGQGALSIALLRALAGNGNLVSYEIRDDFAEQAGNFISEFSGETANHKIVKGDIYDGFEGVYDRVFLDLAEPWNVVKFTKDGLKSGGIIVAYIPTILQVKTYVDTLKEAGYFTEIEIFENIKRPWKVDGLSVRPESWMYNHSAFIVSSRKISI